MCVFFFFCYKSQQARLSLSYALGYDIKSLGSLAEAQHLFVILMVSIRKATGDSGKLIERRALKLGVSAIDWTFSIFGGFVSFVILQLRVKHMLSECKQERVDMEKLGKSQMASLTG